MEQAWLYPQGKKIPKEFNEPVPSEIRNRFVNVGQNFHVPTVSINKNNLKIIEKNCVLQSGETLNFLFKFCLDNGIATRM